MNAEWCVPLEVVAALVTALSAVIAYLYQKLIRAMQEQREWILDQSERYRRHAKDRIERLERRLSEAGG